MNVHAELSALTFELVDEMVAEMRERLAAGKKLSKQEITCVVEQLIVDRAKLRAFMERGTSTIQ